MGRGCGGKLSPTCWVMSFFIVIGDYHHRDLDIVAIDNGTLVIVEVKTRKNEQFADADEAVTVQKVRSLSIAANAYVKRYNINLDIRFDIITVVGQPTGTNEVRHVKDAFLPFI